LRGTRDELSGHGRTTATVPGVGESPIAPDYNGSKTFQRVTWKGAIDHHFTDNLMVYTSVSTGYKAGAYNTFSLNTVPADPETVHAYELGIKSELLDRRVRLNGAVFWNDIENPQVLTVISQGLAVGIGLTNAQKARVRGGEIGVEAIATGGLKLRGAVTYLDAKYTEFTNAPFYSLNGTTLVGPVLGDASGNRLSDVPNLRFDIGANYTVETSVGQWVGDIGVDYTGRFAWTPDNRIFEDSVTLVNASLNFTPSSMNRMSIRLWGKNLGGVKYFSVSQESTGPAGDIGGDIASAAAPRTYGGSISFKF